MRANWIWIKSHRTLVDVRFILVLKLNLWWSPSSVLGLFFHRNFIFLLRTLWDIFYLIFDHFFLFFNLFHVKECWLWLFLCFKVYLLELFILLLSKVKHAILFFLLLFANLGWKGNCFEVSVFRKGFKLLGCSKYKIFYFLDLRRLLYPGTYVLLFYW